MLDADLIVAFLVFAAFLLLLVVSLSAPIIQAISVLNVAANLQAGLLSTAVSGDVKFGLWGYCVSDINTSVFSFARSQAGYCSRVKLGYDFNGYLLYILGISRFDDAISRGLTFGIVLHPIACGLAFSALIFAAMLAFRVTRLAFTMTFILSVISAIISTLAFAVDVTLITIAKYKVGSATGGRIKITYGAAPWLTLGATVALWLATVSTRRGVLVGGKR